MENETIKSPAGLNLDEKHLIKELKLGREKAFRVLVDRYQRRLLKVSYGIVLEEEESLEIVQDVFVTVYRQIGSFRGDSRLFTWLVKITINLSLNWKRRWKRRFRWSHSSFEAHDAPPVRASENRIETPETLYRERELEADIMAAVETLPEKARVVFVLNTLEELSYGEIAQALDIKIGTVKSRLFQARKLLTAVLAQEG
ncbi:DNA-directed RNA polymerase sigma factor [Desulforapulum autotrophicum HRM2]|uniref:RNA polymerase sigma factor n=1 Tax=Desulforapulum autotrophicum (strain ATCC 43914 / DSM 3382 / VKM B-1955 / HRM2) TaxID=177437 RepID=C0QFM1_DESAH|nr:DNA-directed RNA polymerase sigma factor [Desulforapulum autotrophicum HRM2]